jgi:sugar phosphate isomerase/epimerase
MPQAIIANPMCFRELALEDAIRNVLSIGFDLVEIWRQNALPFKTPALRHQLRDFVAEMGSSICGLNSCDAAFFQALSGPETVAEALAGFKGDIDIAADLGGTYVCNFEGRRAPGASDNEIKGPIFDATVSLFKQSCEYGQDKGIDIIVEVHPFTLGTDLDWLCRLCDTIDKDNFGVVYDPCHFGVGLPDTYLQAIGKLGERIKCVHFSDGDKKSSELHFPPGAGCLDLDTIVAELRRINYRGSWMVDFWLYPLPEFAARSGLAYARKLLADW